MPCNSDYMQANHFEANFGRVLRLHDELDGLRKDQKGWHDAGYDDRVYNRGLSNKDLDKETARLCERLKQKDVRKYSLEMQMWWRDHQEADRERERNEARNKKLAELKKKALAKLTDEERKALGVKE